MLKSGVFRDKVDEMAYHIVAYSSEGKGERIELYHRQEDFNIMETYNAQAAYYRKVHECVLGDVDLIRRYMSVYNRCISLKGEINEDIQLTPEGIILTQTKKNESLGLAYEVKTVNGRIAEETYISKEYEIEIIADFNDNSDIFIVPLNIGDYKVVSILSDFHDDSVDDVDYYSIDVLRSRYAIEHIDDYDYIIIKSEEQARRELDEWINAPVKLKSLDVETTGLEVCCYGEDRITGVVMAYDWEDGVEKSVYYPFRQKMFEYNLPIEFLKEISDATFSQPEDVEIIGHNIKMEIKSFMCDNLPLHMTKDTYTLSTLIHTRMERGLHTLKTIVKECTGLHWLSLEEIFKDKVIRFDVLPESIVEVYACPDAPNTIKAYKSLIQKYHPTGMYVFNLECELQYEKAQSEYFGMRTDQKKFGEELLNTEYVFNDLADKFKSIHKTSANINSPFVLRDIIYGQLGCNVLVKTDKGMPSTSAIAVSAIVDHNKIKVKEEAKMPPPIVDSKNKVVIKGEKLMTNKYPSLVILQEYNKKRKELGALNRIKKKSLKDRVMFGINGTGAASGRQTSDAHQYSDTMKSLIVADTPEHRFVSADYSTVELRVLAYLIKDKRLLSMMDDKHIDIHRAFYSTITGTPIHLISSADRKKAKPTNFGVVYGISEYGLVRQQKGAAYTDEDLVYYTKAITDFHIGIPGVLQFAKKNHDFVMEHGYIETEFKYRRFFPKVFEEGLTNKEIGTIKRGANNTPIQGFAAHLLKQAEVNLHRYIKSKGWDKRVVEHLGEKFPLVRLMLSVHDEVLISAHNSISAEEIIVMCKECMEIEVKGAPTFFAVPAFADSWKGAKSSNNEMSIAMRDDVLEAYYRGEYIVTDWDNPGPEIKKYKLNVIKTYMEDLIRKYKTKEEVVKNVTHPEYTHLLVECYVDEKAYPNLTQIDYINMAVEAYMSDSTMVIEDVIKVADSEEDKAIVTDYNYLTELEEYIEIDDNGEARILDESIVVEEVDDLSPFVTDITKHRKSFNDNSTVYAVYTSDSVIIDTSLIQSVEELKALHEDILTLCEDDGYYRVVYMRGPTMMDANVAMYPKQEQLDKILHKYIDKYVEGDLKYG